MNIVKIQREIAASTDVIFNITEKMCRLAMEYGQIDMACFGLKRDILSEQLQQTVSKLSNIGRQIDGLENQPESLKLSRQVLEQNLALCAQDLQSLAGFKEHAKAIKGKQAIIHAFEKQAAVQDLQHRLQEMKGGGQYATRT